MSRTKAQREFAIVPPDLRKVWLLPGLALLAAIVGAVIATRDQPHAWQAPPMLALLGVVIWLVLRRRRVLLDNGELVVRAGLNSRRVALSELDLAQARIVNLGERTEWKPQLKYFGTSLPGYRAGHFRLRDGSRAFMLLTDTSRVLVLPERSGRRLLLSLDKPQALLDALRAAPQP